MKLKPAALVFYIGLFLVITGGSFAVFSQLVPATNLSINNSKNEPTSVPKKTGILTFTGPKTEICPLTGEMFTSQEKDLWSVKRPLTVMIENHTDARPQSGLNSADVVYEAVAEGAITRFEAVFYCNIQKGAENKYDVGPVRSARTYFLDLASEYSDYPLYTHVGGSNCSAPMDPVTGRKAGPCTTNIKAQALEQIASYGWNNKGTWGDLSQFSLSYKACRREPDRVGVSDIATEHTMYCSTTELWNVAASRGLTNMTEINKNSWDKNFRSWSFKAVDAPSTGATSISFDFWSGYKDYSVVWKYDATQKLYLRSNGGKTAIDFNNQEQLNSKNIIIEFAKENRSIDEHLHNLYAVIGSGTGVLLQNGTKTDITWTKANRTSRTVYKDTAGKEVNLIPGRTWIEILPIGANVSYEG